VHMCVCVCAHLKKSDLNNNSSSHTSSVCEWWCLVLLCTIHHNRPCCSTGCKMDSTACIQVSGSCILGTRTEQVLADAGFKLCLVPLNQCSLFSHYPSSGCTFLGQQEKRHWCWELSSLTQWH